jgi:hypothetical protein
MYIEVKETYYKLLVDAGHTHTKALEILLEAKRRDEWACCWIYHLRMMKFEDDTKKTTKY